MNIVIQFNNDNEIETIKASNPSLVLTEIQYLFTGNYLVFKEEVPNDPLTEIQNTVDLILLKQEGIIIL